MSGAMRRIGEYLGLLEDTGRYDEFADDPRYADGQGGQYADHPTQETERLARQAPATRRMEQPVGAGVPAGAAAAGATVADLAERRRPVSAVPTPAPAPVAADLSRIITLHPSTYNEARTVGEHYRDGLPVIMNLTEMDDNDAKRLVDFAAGLVFATHGRIERITAKVFLLSPHNVSVAAEEKQRIVEGGFFNQS